MDCDTTGCKQERYDEISNEMRNMLIKVEWKTVCIAKNTAVVPISGWMSDDLDFIPKNTPVVPISGWMSDNLDFIAKNTPVFPISGSISDNLSKKPEDMAWRKGMKACVDAEEFHVDTLYDELDKVHEVPSRPLLAPMRMPISGIYETNGVGDVLGEEILFASNPCTGKDCTVEMHHQRVDQTCPGDIVGFTVKGLVRNNMPFSGDVIECKKDTILGQTKKFNAQIQVLNIPKDVRCGHAACRISRLRKHHQRVDQTCPGDNVDLNFKGLDMNNMPRPGDHPGDNVAVDIKRLDKKSGRPSFRTTRRWWPAGVPAPRTSRRTWPAGAPAPCTTMAHTQTHHETPVDTQTIPMTPTLMTSIATQTTDLSHETNTSVETQTIPMTPTLMTSIATQTTDLSHETSTSVETQTVPMTPTPMTSIATQTTDLSHETSTSVETQTVPMTPTPMTSIATQTTDLSHETSTSVETQTVPMTPTPMTSIATPTTDLSHETRTSVVTQTISIWGIEEVCQICGDSSDESDAENIETDDEMQPLLWDARDWMKHASVEVGGA